MRGPVHTSDSPAPCVGSGSESRHRASGTRRSSPRPSHQAPSSARERSTLDFRLLLGFPRGSASLRNLSHASPFVSPTRCVRPTSHRRSRSSPPDEQERLVTFRPSACRTLRTRHPRRDICRTARGLSPGDHTCTFLLTSSAGTYSRTACRQGALENLVGVSRAMAEHLGSIRLLPAKVLNEPVTRLRARRVEIPDIGIEVAAR